MNMNIKKRYRGQSTCQQLNIYSESKNMGRSWINKKGNIPHNGGQGAVFVKMLKAGYTNNNCIPLYKSAKPRSG
jgi:hypothetical protein